METLISDSQLSQQDQESIQNVYKFIEKELDLLGQSTYHFSVSASEVDNKLGDQNINGHCISFERDVPQERNFTDILILKVLKKFIFSKSEYEAKDADFVQNQAVDQLRIIRTGNKSIGLFRGQYGEMLLFALLTHHFKAPPLVKLIRQNINDEFEVTGADALHIHFTAEGVPKLYLGEAKCKDDILDGIHAAIESAFDTYNDLIEKNVLYTRYENHYAKEFDSIYKHFLRNDFSGELDIVALIVCDLKLSEKFQKDSKENYKLIENWVKSKISSIEKTLEKHKSNRKFICFNKMHFIIFPIHKMECHLEKILQNYFYATNGDLKKEITKEEVNRAINGS